MKKTITLLTLFISLNTFAQEIKILPTLKRDFYNYYNLISAKKIDSALNYSNPKFFELIPRDQMKNLMEAVYKLPNVEYKTGIPTFLKVEELKKINNTNYVKFYIRSPIEMKFTDTENSEDKILAITKNLEQKFGAANVKYDKPTGFFKINAEKIIIASSTDENQNWKFLTVDNPRMKTILEKIIPV